MNNTTINSGFTRYSPISEEDVDEPHLPLNLVISSRDQPLDFSTKTSESYWHNVNTHHWNVSTNAIKRETQQRVSDPMTLQYHKHHQISSRSPTPRLTGSHSLRFHTPSPSPSPLDRQMRKRAQPLPEEVKDEAYWVKRKKNNESAKRSRDSKRDREDETAIRLAFLEEENLQLRLEVAQLKCANSRMK